ncbi:hypothetical protein MnTg03_00048 [bacterium MnTg03]|nr:hypothetical protein MnTg03_00048 [bacterium MnTg03]
MQWQVGKAALRSTIGHIDGTIIVHWNTMLTQIDAFEYIVILCVTDSIGLDNQVDFGLVEMGLAYC